MCDQKCGNYDILFARLKAELERQHKILGWKTSFYQKQTQELRDEARRKDAVIIEHNKTLESLIFIIQKLQYKKAKVYEKRLEGEQKHSKLKLKMKSVKRAVRRYKSKIRELAAERKNDEDVESDGSASDSNEGERVSSPGEGPSGASEDEASPGSDGHDSEQ